MTIGRIESIELRSVWPHEERDFSAWLAENIDLVGLELGIELRFVAREFGIGRFSLDILAHDDTNDRSVIIENQLGQTDHDHLGKLLTYAAGNDAHVIIWIANHFLDEHRAALDWLNRTSETGRSFFGIEIDAIRIGASLPAPRFKVVSQPNEWRNAVSSRNSRPSPDGSFFYSFYEKLRNALADTSRYPRLKSVGARADYVPFNIKPSIYYAFSWSRSSFILGLYIATPNPTMNSALYREIEKHRDDIDLSMSMNMVWDFKEDRRRQQIYGELGGITNREEPEAIDKCVDWGTRTLEKMIACLEPFVTEAIALRGSAEIDTTTLA